MRSIAVVVCVLSCLLAAGCYEAEEEFTINADGSGSADFTIRVIPQAAALLEEMAREPAMEFPISLPITEEGVRVVRGTGSPGHAGLPAGHAGGRPGTPPGLRVFRRDCAARPGFLQFHARMG